MAALSGITAVRPTEDTQTRRVQYGATVSAGNPVYRDAADGKYKVADANASSSTAAVVGVAMTPGIDTGYGLIAISGSIVLVGTTMAVGSSYYVSATAGSIIPEADLATNDYVSRIGTASSATQIILSLEATGVQHA
jgi:hypothetical protein